MSSTAEELYQACYDDLFPSVAVMHDYFGIGNQGRRITDKEMSNLLGLYQGIIKIIIGDKLPKHTIIEELQKAFYTNSIDKYIDKYYDYLKSKGRNPYSSAYYSWYKNTNYKVGSTYIELPEE
jgi:hypothetical protein